MFLYIVGFCLLVFLRIFVSIFVSNVGLSFSCDVFGFVVGVTLAS